MKKQKSNRGSAERKSRSGNKAAKSTSEKKITLWESVPAIRAVVAFMSVFMILFSSGLSGAASYKLTLSQPVKVSPSAMEFSITLGSEGSEAFTYSLGQFFLSFNPAIANGGNLSLSIVASDLPEVLQPRNPSVVANWLRLSCNAVSRDESLLPKIYGDSKQLLIARLRLETTAGEFSNAAPDIEWADNTASFRTKIFALIDGQHTNLTESGKHVLQSDDPLISAGTDAGNPDDFALGQNYPNPFNPETTIRFALPVSAHVVIRVFDITGKEVMKLVDEKRNAGFYENKLSAVNLSSGVYFYRLQAGSFQKTMRMIVLK